MGQEGKPIRITCPPWDAVTRKADDTKWMRVVVDPNATADRPGKLFDEKEKATAATADEKTVLAPRPGKRRVGGVDVEIEAKGRTVRFPGPPETVYVEALKWYVRVAVDPGVSTAEPGPVFLDRAAADAAGPSGLTRLPAANGWYLTVLGGKPTWFEVRKLKAEGPFTTTIPTRVTFSAVEITGGVWVGVRLEEVDSPYFAMARSFDSKALAQADKEDAVVVPRQVGGWDVVVRSQDGDILYSLIVEVRQEVAAGSKNPPNVIEAEQFIKLEKVARTKGFAAAVEEAEKVGIKLVDTPLIVPGLIGDPEDRKRPQ